MQKKKEKEKIKKPKYISINKISNKNDEINIIKYNNHIQRNAIFSSINKKIVFLIKIYLNAND